MKKILYFLSAIVLMAACDDTVEPPVEEKPIDPSALGTGLTSDPQLPDADAACILYYKADSKSPFYNYSEDLYAHIGVVDETWKFVQANWNENKDKCKFIPVAENVWKLPLEPTIRDYFASGNAGVERIGVVVRNSDGTKQTEDLFIKVQDDKNQFVPAEVKMLPLPSGAEHGINYNADGSVTLVFYEKDKNGKRFDYCYLIGDFSNWERQDAYIMNRDEDAGCWWYTMTEVDADKEYMFQYYVGNVGGDKRRFADPYSEIVYEQYDKYISASIYPDMPEYPSATSGVISAFQVNRPEYAWQIEDYVIEDEDDLLIYELLLRDFTATRDLKGAIEKLDYLKTLGINAIELMPIQEFSGADSWGYNPIAYFALEKAYGTREMYKQFIDECHRKGMAVIVDVVYNHVHEDHAMAGLYFDWGTFKPTADNPWFNVTAPHPFSVFHDWNHENEMVREHIKRSLTYLIEEYKVDGFRFDLTKGFTNKASNESSASNYDASRVAILTEYGSHIKEVDPNAVVILEHFADSENKDLSKAGMKVWRNMNHSYRSSVGGSAADFSGLWSGNGDLFGAYVGFMESHDEERTCYGATAATDSKSVKWGICGTITNWTSDIALNADGSFYAARSVEFGASDMFKIRGNASWDDAYNYGASRKGYKLPLNEGYALTKGSGSADMAVPAAGKYDIYFSPDAGMIWLMEEGKRPEEPEVENVDYLERAMRRSACNAAFFFTVPGPKMIWQFGELGYDVSIEAGGRTGKKPLHWEYYDVPARKALYDTYADLMKFRKDNPEFFTKEAEFKWKASSGNHPAKTITCAAGGKRFTVVGNFGSETQAIEVAAGADGTWYNYFDRDETYSGETFTVNLKEGEYRLLVNW